jgi:hypothetical protein
VNVVSASETNILSDSVAEARRLLSAADDAGLILRAMGGVGISLHTRLASAPPFRRDYGDLDFACSRKTRRHLPDFFAAQGYQPNLSLNAHMGQVRQMYLDPDRDRHVDMFIGQLNMCHRIPLEERLQVEDLTVPLAELVVSKLQVVELSEKDALDVCAVLAEHPVAEHDNEAVNGSRIAALCAADWGLWRTFKLNLQRMRELLPSFALAPEWELQLYTALDNLEARIDTQTKSLRWRLRSLIGDRIRWYDLPEEMEKR